MSDPLTPIQRHLCMSRIRSKDTRPELIVRQFLYAHGIRYRLHGQRLPGRPDVVIRRLHTVVMVNGCFWHGHTLEDGTSCRMFVMPKSRTDFWSHKITTNQQRDLRTRRQLTAMGWNVITIWECQLRPHIRQQTLMSLLYTLNEIELKMLRRRAAGSPSAPSPQPSVAYDLQEEDWTPRMAADDSEIDK